MGLFNFGAKVKLGDRLYYLIIAMAATATVTTVWIGIQMGKLARALRFKKKKETE